MLTIVNLMQTQGVPQALSRAIAGGSDESAAWRAALHVQTVASAGGFLLLALSAPVLASVLDDQRLLSGLLIAALAVPSYALFATLGGVLNGRRDFARQARMNAIYAAARVVCVLGLAFAFQFGGAIAGYAVAPLIASAAVFSLRPRGDGRAPFDWHALVRFALPNIGLALALTAIMSVDLLFVKGIVPDDATAGIYAAAQNAARLTYFVIIPAGLVLFPAMADAMASHDRPRQRVLVGDGIEGAVAVVLGLVAVMTGARVLLLDLAFGPAYEGAATAFELLAPALGFLALAYTLASLLTGSGHPHPPMRVAAAALLLQLVLEYPLTKAYGMTGAALGTLIAATLCMLGQGLLVRSRFGTFGDVSGSRACWWRPAARTRSPRWRRRGSTCSRSASPPPPSTRCWWWRSGSCRGASSASARPESGRPPGRRDRCHRHPGPGFRAGRPDHLEVHVGVPGRPGRERERVVLLRRSHGDLPERHAVGADGDGQPRLRRLPSGSGARRRARARPARSRPPPPSAGRRPGRARRIPVTVPAHAPGRPRPSPPGPARPGGGDDR